MKHATGRVRFCFNYINCQEALLLVAYVIDHPRFLVERPSYEELRMVYDVGYFISSSCTIMNNSLKYYLMVSVFAGA